MTKQAEIDYFANMTPEALRFARDKPFSAEGRGPYLIDVGQILSLIRKPPARLLDIGCGSGWTTAMFARAGFDALGTDLAPAAIELASDTYGPTGARFEVRDSEALAFDTEFDVAVIYDCLHHADDPAAVIRCVHRALKPGGEVVIVEPGEGHHLSETSQVAVAAHGVTERDMPPALTTRLLRAAGFAEVRVFPRVQYQMVEREGTGGIARRLAPLLGRRIAALLKTLKNSVWTRKNGVVLGVKALEARR